MNIHWARLASCVATAVLGIGGAWVILTADHAPTWTIALSGVLGLAGVAAAAVIILFIAIEVVGNIRPSVRFCKPVVPMALAHREASLVGQKRYRLHPIKFWGVFTLNSRFLLGFILFDPVEYVTAKDEDQ